MLKKTVRSHRRLSRASGKRSPIKICKSFQPHRCDREAGTSVGQPQAGAYIPPPSAAIARQPRTHCTDAGLARRPLRFTPEVNSGYLRSSAGRHFPSPECRRLPSAPDTLYCPLTCTVVISFNGGSKFRLFMTTGRAPDVARGPRALRGACFAANEGLFGR